MTWVEWDEETGRLVERPVLPSTCAAPAPADAQPATLTLGEGLTIGPVVEVVPGSPSDWEDVVFVPSDFGRASTVSPVVDAPSPTSCVVIVEDEERLFDLLDRMNSNGVNPELPCLSLGSRPFLATLTEPDAGHVEYVVTDEGGRVHCCECYHGENYPPRDCLETGWVPVWPVLALAAFDVTALPNPNAEPVDTAASDAEAANDTRPAS